MPLPTFIPEGMMRLPDGDYVPYDSTAPDVRLDYGSPFRGLAQATGPTLNQTRRRLHEVPLEDLFAELDRRGVHIVHLRKD